MSASPVRTPPPRGGSPLQRGSDPTQFRLVRGGSVTIRVVGVGTPQHEAVGSALVELEGDVGEGHVYRYTAEGGEGEVQHVLLSFTFQERFEPPARYTISIEGPGDGPAVEAPPVFQPSIGSFPQTVAYALTFTLFGDDTLTA